MGRKTAGAPAPGTAAALRARGLGSVALVAVALAACTGTVEVDGRTGVGSSGGASSSSGATSSGAASGGATSGGTASSGGTTSGGATSGGTTSGGATSGGTTSGGTSGGGVPVTVVVAPREPSVAVGRSVALSASVTGSANTAVSWTVPDGANAGTVTTAGRYTAPDSPGVYHVVAASEADPSAADTATVTVTDPVGTDGDGKFTIASFPTQPELTDRGAPKGKRFSFTMDSTKSKIFDGRDPTLVPSKPRSLTRQIWVYVPAAYVDGTPAPLLVIQDGPGPLDEIAFATDNMTRSTDPARKVPPFISVAVQNGGNDAQGSERGLEYDTLSDRYARFIEEEVLPAVRADPQIKAVYPRLAFTDDPEGRATYGCSSGAAAAFTMAWFRPDLFRRVLSYSGTLVAQQNTGQPESSVYPLGAWEYHSSLRLIATTPRKPLRIFLNVNEFDLRSGDPESTFHNWVMANERTAAALGDRGYHYRYALAKGLGHCDPRAMRATLADALAWVWRGY